VYTNVGAETIPSSTKGVVILGSTAEAETGSALSMVSDVNGDGFDDFLIASYKASPYGRNIAGMVNVVFGRRTFNDTETSQLLTGPTTGFKVYGAQAGAYTGVAVSGAGDLNSDGIGDFMVGADHFTFSDRSEGGVVYVLFGRSSNNVDIDLRNVSSNALGFRIIGAAAGDKCGSALANLGDINGDHIDDIIIGVSRHDALTRLNAVGRSSSSERATASCLRILTCWHLWSGSDSRLTGLWQVTV
jgi:hypothetical protein